MVKKTKFKENLGAFGTKYQYQLVKLLIENNALFLQVQSYLKVEAFTDNTLILILNEMLRSYSERNTLLTYKDIEIYLKDKSKSEQEMEKFKEAVRKLKDDDLLKGMDYVRDTGIKFFKQAEATRILSEATAKIEKNGYNQEILSEMVEEMAKVEKGDIMTLGSSGDELFNAVMDAQPVDKIPTGLVELDEHMHGGLPKKSLGLIIAPTNIGKTTFSSIIAINAALRNYKVLHINFEDGSESVGRMYYAHMTNKPTSYFINAKNKAGIKEEILNSHPNAYNALWNNIRFKQMPNGETTVEDIKNLINNLANVQGWKADLVVIDYLSCLKGSSNTLLQMQNEFQIWERAAKRLEAMANEMNIAIWLCQQTNRDAEKTTTRNDRMANVQGSYRITQPASFILYLEKNENADNLVNIYLDKSRGCAHREWQDAYFNRSTCQIQLALNPNLQYNGPYNTNNQF